MTRVLLVEDHTSFRTAIAFMIGRDLDITVLEAGSIAEAGTVAAAATQIDVALIDLTLTDGQGLDFLPTLHARHPEAVAIILTGSGTKVSRALAVASGAAGFLEKTATIEEILSTIRHAAAGDPLLTPDEITRLMHQAARHQTRTGAMERALAQLTPREREVLRSLADGLDNQHIADRLNLSTTTVRSHVAQLLHKLDVNSRLQAALIAVRHGIVNEDPPAAE